MLVLLAIAFLVGWVLVKIAFGVASFAVHALLALAAVALVAHFVRGHFGRGTTAQM
jgi:uncharacterized membrane protein YGL010W